MVLSIWKITTDWNIYYFVQVVANVAFWIASFMFPESPHQLLHKGRYEELKLALRRIYRINHITNKRITESDLNS